MKQTFPPHWVGSSIVHNHHVLVRLGDVKMNLRVSCADNSVASVNSTAMILEDAVSYHMGEWGSFPVYWDKVVTDDDGTGENLKK